MDHPGIIALKDVFLKPASTGARRPGRTRPACAACT
jgi:hypothetical protein